MAKSMMLSASVTVLLAIGALLAPALARTLDAVPEATSPSPAPPSGEPFWKKCKNHVRPWCGKEIFFGIFHGGKVSETCCEDLITMGKPCNDVLVGRILALQHPPYPPKSEEVWQTCIETVEKKAPASSK